MIIVFQIMVPPKSQKMFESKLKSLGIITLTVEENKSFNSKDRNPCFRGILIVNMLVDAFIKKDKKYIIGLKDFTSDFVYILWVSLQHL